MMKIECIRRKRKDGTINFNWRAQFGVSVDHKSRPFNCREVIDQITHLEKLTPIFTAFLDEISKEDYPNEGPICAIVVDSSDIDENQIFKANKVLNKLRESFFMTHPKRKEAIND